MPHPGQNPREGREDILVAATDLFAESGYDAVSIKSIADRAGTSKANVFHHFGSKESLYLEVMRSACGGFDSASDVTARTGSACDRRVIDFLRADLEQLRADPDQAHLILREVLESGPGRGKTLATDVFDEHFKLVTGLFREGQKAGLFAPDIPPGAAAVALIGVSVFVFQSRHVLRHFEEVDFVDDPDRYAALIGRVLLDGLRHRPADD